MLVDQIDAELPQTQCRRCGYDGCRPYAEALASGESGIDRCPPGGDRLRHALARLLGLAPPPGPLHPEPVSTVATIIEVDCIGCTKCIQVCPMDAIIGAAGYMHTVVAPWCTGCDLCAPVCPTDCIKMSESEGTGPDADTARVRYIALTQREMSPRHDLEMGYVDLHSLDRAALREAVLDAVARKQSTDE